MQRSLAHRCGIIVAVSLFLFFTCCFNWNIATAFQPLKGDMDTFIPGKSDTPVTGDTIKVGLVNPFSGAAASAGEWFYISLAWVVHDINSQGGFWLTGK